MDSRNLIAAGFVIGAVALGIRAFSRAKAPELSSAEFTAYVDSDGFLNLDPAFKPAINSDNSGFEFNSPFSGMAGSPQLGDFDWGDWATVSEWHDWGAQRISLPAESLPNEDEIDLMNVNQLIVEVADHLMRKEGFRPFIYDDFNGKSWTQSQRGNPTIGYGHLVTQADIAVHGWNWTMDESEAYGLLLSDVNSHLAPIVPAVTVPLTLGQWVAITSLAFNAGPYKLRDSKFIKAVNRLDWVNAEIEFKDWNKATVVVDGQRVKRVVNGLVNRRNEEWQLFASGGPVLQVFA